MTENRDFKGVWIPKEIWLNEDLTMIEKVVLIEIDSLDNEEGCVASNEYLANFCQCSETKVSTAISKLIKMGYIYQQSFNGRIRILKSRLSKFERQTFTNCKADIQKVKHNNIDNNIDNKRVVFTPPTRDEVLDYARSKSAVALGEKFYDYFVEGNWKDSKGNKVKNWKQKFLTWLGHTTPDKSNFSTGRQYTREEMNANFQKIDEIEI